MTSSEVWDAETAKRYDHDSAEMFAPDVLLSTVDFLAQLAGSGAALEFAVGTGRVAIPLIQRGVPVTGIELWIPPLRRMPPGQTAVPMGSTTTIWCSTPTTSSRRKSRRTTCGSVLMGPRAETAGTSGTSGLPRAI